MISRCRPSRRRRRASIWPRRPKPLQVQPALQLRDLDAPLQLTPRQQQEMLQRMENRQPQALPGQPPRAPWERPQPLPRFDPQTGKPRAIPMHELPKLPGR